MTLLSLLLLMIALPLYAQGRLTYYCSTDIAWCELMKKEFEKRTGIRVSMTRASTGETLAKIRAEKSNPKGDV
ncbi:MAG: iron ABC transporter substrate-binding protein, partial [Deltaproteobacteria bacterium]|nr:iron ABC transporter substrate-binding protein [Deltaproteobacteria bacterium]